MSLERGQPIGRFVVIGLVGRGGMGEVYAAYDPELDRKVAVKVLRPRMSRFNAHRTLLLREAQAIAKLSHPNVLVVYDVGTLGDSVFIAMEFVDGETVGAWLKREHRSWREVLKIFVAAGKGLAAAHDAGLVHRDFKPENVMITRDGQVRVMDFGLARAVDARADAPREPEPADPAAAERLLTTSSALQIKITQTGAHVGTPAYMSPEQFLDGATADARTDQFNFCVALYEGLYGERPFGTDDAILLQSRVIQGRVMPAPAQSGVPPWLRRILLRGLRPIRDDRFPSMPALLAALEDDPGVKRRKWLTITAATTLALGFATAANRIGSGQRTMCLGSAARLDGIWEPRGTRSARKDAIRAVFVKTDKPYAAQSFQAASRLLDDYVASWVSMYTEACEATHVRGEQSEEVLDLRMACLQERLTNVRALSDVLLSADGSVVENAATAAGALPAVDRCADVPLLRAVVKPPEDPARRARVEALREELARMDALANAGQCRAAEPKATQLIDAARATGYKPLLADTLLAAGHLGNACDELPRSLQRLREAYWAGLESHADRVAAEAACSIAGLAAHRDGQLAVAREWLSTARAMVGRVGGSPLLRAWFDVSEGLVLAAGGEYERAVEAERDALAIKERILGPEHPDTLLSLLDVGSQLLSANHAEEALAIDRRARLSIERTLSAQHPWYGIISSNEGEALNQLGRHAHAVEAFQSAIKSMRSAGSDALLVTYPETGLGIAYLGLGRPEEAIAPLEDAYRVRRSRGAPVEQTAEVQFALARALWHREPDRERARGLAVAARGEYAALPKPAKALAEVEAWLAHPGAKL
jgi:tetratricopeptide (TPR) repeat protein